MSVAARVPTGARFLRLGSIDVVAPAWDGGLAVRAFTTLRSGGVSRAPYGAHDGSAGLNLGVRTGDDPTAVAENRRRVARLLPSAPCWLQQEHGTTVHVPGDPVTSPPVADAAVTNRPGEVLVVQTADCLPILVADRDGRAIAAIHAGWRGLAEGVVERALERVAQWVADPSDLRAWIGPGIGAAAFEVGSEVRAAFCDRVAAGAARFVRGPSAGKWFADLPGLAYDRLTMHGLEQVSSAATCTFQQSGLCYSYRRDRVTGRMGSFIWIRPG